MVHTVDTSCCGTDSVLAQWSCIGRVFQLRGSHLSHELWLNSSTTRNRALVPSGVVLMVSSKKLLKKKMVMN